MKCTARIWVRRRGRSVDAKSRMRSTLSKVKTCRWYRMLIASEYLVSYEPCATSFGDKAYRGSYSHHTTGSQKRHQIHSLSDGFARMVTGRLALGFQALRAPNAHELGCVLHSPSSVHPNNMELFAAEIILPNARSNLHGEARQGRLMLVQIVLWLWFS